MGSIGKFLGRLFGHAAGRGGRENRPMRDWPKVSRVDSDESRVCEAQGRSSGAVESSPHASQAVPAPAGSRLSGPWSVGKTVGEIYRIRNVLGRGGMGIVYLADDLATHRNVAVKVPLGKFVDDPVARKQFTREAEAWTELVHPHIVHAFDVRDDQTTDYRPVIVMDYCDGGSLHERICRRGGLSLPDALDIAIQVCWGMEFAHKRGYIHRDLKPSNVLLTSDGRALVTDLGLSKRVEAQDVGIVPGRLTDADAKVLASVSQSGGTPEYMPPEQWAGQAGKESDIYAFGVMLYELFCGCLPFQAENRLALRVPHEKTPPRDPRQINSRIPGDLAELILACLAKRPKERPDFGTLADRLLEAWGSVSAGDYGARRRKPTGRELSRADQDARAGALIRLGIGCRLRGDLDDALRHWCQAEALYRELGDKAGLKAALGDQAVILYGRGDLDGAMKLHKEAGRLSREVGDRAGLQASLANQALLLNARGDLDGAMKLHKEQERLCRELGDKAGLGRSLDGQALILKAWGRLDEAMKLHKEEERLCRELGDKDGLQLSLGNQAVILWDLGDLDGATKLHKEEEHLCRELGDKAGLSRSLCNQALILCDLGDLDGATELHKEEERLCRELGDKAGLSRSLGNQGLILGDRGDLDGAMRLHKEMERLCRELGLVEGLAISLANQASLLGLRMGRRWEALSLAEEAYRLASRHGLNTLAQRVKSLLEHLRSGSG